MTLELFGMKLQIIEDLIEDDDVSMCKSCALNEVCNRPYELVCETSDGRSNRHFELVK